MSGPVEPDVYVCPDGPGFERCCAEGLADRPCVSTVEAAVALAPDGGVVELGPGTYPAAVVLVRDVTLRGRPRALAPILSTADPTARAIVQVDGPFVVTIQRLVLTSSATRALEGQNGADLRVVDTTILAAGARDFGGAVRAKGGRLTLEGTRIDGGTAEADGGQVHASDAEVTLVRSDFFRGTAVRDGGAVAVSGDSVLTIDRCLFSGATAYKDGGAVALDGPVSATIRSATFVDDTALRDGGALSLGAGSGASVSDSRFVRDSAVRAGGAVAADGAVLALDRCELALNRTVGDASGSGGAVWWRSEDPAASVTWTNDRFVENAAPAEGGALRLSVAGSVRLAQATFLGNAAARGGGLAVRGAGDVALDGAVIAYTAAGGGLFDPQGIVSPAASIWFRNAEGDVVPAASPDPAAANVVGVDPRYFAYTRNADLVDDDLGVHPDQSPLAGVASGSNPDGTPADAGDGGGPAASPDRWEDPDGDGWPEAHDCNDADPRIHPRAREADGDGVDADCDGSDGVDLDRDGFLADVDCDDTDPETFPGAREDDDLAVDQDCDGWASPRRGVRPAGCAQPGHSGAPLLWILALALARRRLPQHR